MENCDPISAQSAEDQNIRTAPVQETVAEETVKTEDPEAAAEDIMTESELEAVEEEQLTQELLIEKANAVLAKDAADITPDDIRHLRQMHNALHKDEPQEETAQDEFKTILEAVRAKRAEHTAKVEAERAENLARKQAIVDEINALAEDTDNVNRTFPRYRELQDEFNALGDVPPTEETAIWKRFQEAREHYSDNLKINKELRDYDFKKNLDTKELLIGEAEGLIVEEDVIVAHRRLQELHNKWRQVGPVAKEIRDEVWNRFRAASAEVAKRYQAYFEARKAEEAANEAVKTALCEKMEALDLEALKTFVAWDEATAQVRELQEQWRAAGPANRKANRQLFTRFRELCDKFFAAKAEYFHSTRDAMAANLARKTALAERAEALRESTDWKSATDEFVALQKEWKTIGTVAKKYSDAVWKRFQTACDSFFEAKKKATGDIRKTEQENLRAKRELIARIGEITPDTPREEALEILRSVQDQWKEIGHVPFRDKNKIYEEFRAKVDEVRAALNLRRTEARRERFKESVAAIEGDAGKLNRERERLARALEGRRRDLATYENNLGFLTSKSKSGNSMVREMERKVEALRADIADLEQKIRILDSKI
ncbi:MAG: DUF349 domain-containing protein [Muribaculaceae bacterium]|nr:DUF349 domain-containing protein [Muribaculaceae bacterium]